LVGWNAQSFKTKLNQLLSIAVSCAALLAGTNAFAVNGSKFPANATPKFVMRFGCHPVNLLASNLKKGKIMITVPASRGIEWLKSAVETVMRYPMQMLVMGLISAVLLGIPFLNLITFLIVPALMAGIQYSARKADAGQMPDIADLFAPLQMPGKIGQLIILVLPGLLLGIVIAVLVFVVMGAAIAAGSVNGAMGGVALIGFIGFVLGLFVYALVFFSISRVTFDNLDAITAMKESLSAVVKNIGAVLVFVACIIAAYLVLVVALMIPILGLLIAIAFSVVAFPVIAVSLYRAYQDVFGVASQQAMPMVPQGYAPPPPPGPPQF
jgi:uncharacterized membrane protein